MNGYRTGFFYGDYKVLYCVGAGTFARVYRATHKQTGEDVRREGAPQPLQQPQGHRRQDGQEQQAVHRALPPRRRNRHPAQAPEHRRESTRSIRRALTHYLVMEFIEGQNLREFYRARRRFDPLEAAHIMEGVMSGLNYALQQGITHRDLKMSNVLLSSDGEPKLVDFGLAGVEGEVEDDSIEGISRRTVDYAGLERRQRRPQGRSTHRHLLLRLHFLPNAQRPAGARRIARSAQAGKARYSTTSSRF